ncbi:hypothetical protein B5P45_20500 [Phyllobacterium zundukense]|uniref:Uncharacterized protein n=2 Tax=Phyllobacterium zundukense TaxID=1867719 RepID=A0A2N9VTL6_9HYPH|nr:hypothetical protein B5P45_20500 [Phyllobacterium zundukense]
MAMATTQMVMTAPTPATAITGMEPTLTAPTTEATETAVRVAVIRVAATRVAATRAAATRVVQEARTSRLVA